MDFSMSRTAARTRKNPAERREEILSAAIALADQIGLDRLTGRDVAFSMGIVPGLIHHYFPTIDDLIVAAFRRVVTEDLTHLHDGLEQLPAVPAIEEFLCRALNSDRRRPLSFWMSAWVAAPRRPSLSIEVDAQMIAGVERLSALLERGRSEGAFTILDPQRSADCIYIALDGIAVQRTVRPTTDVDSDLIVLIARTAEQEAGLRDGALAKTIVERITAHPPRPA